ncbi:MAG: hypothetical protein V1927_01540 [Candidatus Omnitrophota bacterium]
MSRKAVAVMVVVVFCLTGICGVSYAATAKKPQAVTPAAAKVPAMPPRPSNINTFSGTIEKIDAADPANIKMQVKDEASGTSRTISVAPWTNITKVTDVSELKTGDAIRVMIRKVEDKDVAMGIVFGKIKNLPPMRPRTAAPATPQAPAKLITKEAVKK